MELFTICLTSLLSFVVLFLAAKLIGRKQISQLDFMDYITGITIGSIAAELATNLEDPWKPLTALVFYGLVTWLVSVVDLRWARTRRYLNGAPVILMDGGKLFRDNLKRMNLELSEFLALCRQQGYFDLSAIRTAVFEYNGTLSILPVASRRPATPQDLSLDPPQEYLSVEVIMDGRIIDENLRRMGLNSQWLQKQLAAQNIASPDEVFLALCDVNHNLSCYQAKCADHSPGKGHPSG